VGRELLWVATFLMLLFTLVNEGTKDGLPTVTIPAG
jgi:hypothetical protein